MKNYENRYCREVCISAGVIYKPEEIENHPEYWEKVEEKGYEILSFSYMNSIYDKKKGDRLYSESSGSILLSQHDHKDVSIHSVKRLEDGEVFSIGNICKKPKDASDLYHLNYQQIEKFKIVNNCVEVKFKSILRTNLENLNKIELPATIFYSDSGDNAPIKERDEYWSVSLDTYELKDHIAKIEDREKRNIKKFTNIHEAEDYIFLNKPCLNYKDVIDLYNNYQYIELTEKLKELIKTKLK